MKKVIAYIDGLNLYYGMLKGTPCKWLDLEKFVDALVADDVEVIAIKYFTAQIKTYPFDLQKVQRQQFYIRAVGILPRVKVIEGFYTKHKIRMPFYKEPCVSCDKTDGMASVVKLEGKRSDVNIATEMLLDATSPATCPPSASFPKRSLLAPTAISSAVQKRGVRLLPCKKSEKRFEAARTPLPR